MRSSTKHKVQTGLGASAAISLVVANMIGTGVFISLGYQLVDFSSAPPIMFLWLVGGIIALCGALSYATLAEQLPRSGGEYHFLGQTWHPALGFMGGLLSAIVGFAVPTAITALAMGGYLSKAWPEIPVRGAAVAVILVGSAAHGISTKSSGRVQLFSTALKLLLIALFLVSVVILPGKGDIRWSLDPVADLAQIGKPAFATAIFFVFYAYSGWNAAVYGFEEWNQPGKTVRIALVGGTLIVILLYIGLNAAFLVAAPVAELTGQQEIAHVAAKSLFGNGVGRLVSALFAIGLFASVSALLWAGPRVLAAMGRDVQVLRFFSSDGGVPVASLGFQALLAIVLVVVGDLESLISYTQTGLTLCTFLAVSGLFILKFRGREIGASTMVPALIFVAFTGFVIVRMFVADPIPAISGVGTAIFCALLWFPIQRFFST
jgi:APA family basic amino acid/polyamine antiporter